MLSTTSLLTAVCPLTRVRSIPFSPSFWVDSNPVVQPINCEFSTLWSPPPLLLPKDFVPFFPLLLRFHELCNNVPLGKRKKGGRVMVCKRVRNPQRKKVCFACFCIVATEKLIICKNKKKEKLGYLGQKL